MVDPTLPVPSPMGSFPVQLVNQGSLVDWSWTDYLDSVCYGYSWQGMSWHKTDESVWCPKPSCSTPEKRTSVASPYLPAIMFLYPSLVFRRQCKLYNCQNLHDHQLESTLFQGVGGSIGWQLSTPTLRGSLNYSPVISTVIFPFPLITYPWQFQILECSAIKRLIRMTWEIQIQGVLWLTCQILPMKVDVILR